MERGGGPIGLCESSVKRTELNLNNPWPRLGSPISVIPYARVRGGSSCSGKGIVFDQPKVVASSTKEVLAELGVCDRVSTVGGSFLEPLPAALSSCDAFYLQFILHDWADEECVSILSAIKAVAKEGSQIVTTDFILGVDGANMEMSKRMMDINMMAANPPGAGERTFAEYAALFSRAGFAKPSQLVKMRDLVSTVVTEV